MKLTRFLLPLLALGLLVFAGCASGPKISRITVFVTDIKPVGDTLVLSLRYANDNTIPLVLSRSVHAIALDGETIGRIVSEQPVGLPPLASATQEIELPGEISAQIRKLARKADEPMSYVVESKLTFQFTDDTLVQTTVNKGHLAPERIPVR